MICSCIPVVLCTLVCILVALFTSIYMYFMKKFNYWKDRNVEHLDPKFPWGNILPQGEDKSFPQLYKNMYEKTKLEKYVGIWMFYRPTLLINDPDIIRDVLIKDFMNFHDRGGYVNEEKDPLTGHLFMLSGSRWKNLRVKLTPVFTSGKIKNMFPLVAEISQEFVEYLSPHADTGDTVEMRDLAARYVTDVIASCVFGLKSDSIQNPDSLFRRMGRSAVEVGVVQNIKGLLAFMAPDAAQFFQMTLTPRDLSKYFIKTVTDAVEHRRKNHVRRNDFLQLLLHLQEHGYVDDPAETTDMDQAVHKLTLNEIAAQSFLFFIAGFDTSATTIQFVLYELSLDQEIQNKCRQEVGEKLKKHGGISYDCVQEMEYLDRVVLETLRKHPPIAIIMRVCTNEYLIPGTEVVVEKGTLVQVPIIGIQNDNRYYQDPDKFDPDRFLPENRMSNQQYTFMPFGHGPRSCIGNRFAMIQIKVGLAELLSKYQFDVTADTPVPMRYAANTFTTVPHGGMNLKISNRIDNGKEQVVK